MSSAIEQGNPLLKIDTSFQSYLVLHSLTTKSTIESLNYSFETDCTSRQTINGLSGWNKLLKAITTTDMPATMKKYFNGAITVDAWNNTEIYDIAKSCAERLKTRLPAIMINTKEEIANMIAISADGIEPCILITSKLIQNCNKDELTFILATGISRVQNNHCIYYFIAPYINFTEGNERQKNFTRIECIPKQLNYTMADWALFSDVTSDRAALICLDDPKQFPNILKSVLQKNTPIFLKADENNKNVDTAAVLEMHKQIRLTAVRELSIDEELGRTERRILCALEFLNCETYYNCRSDITQNERVHTVSKPMVDLRCDIIAGASKGVD